MTWQDFWAGLTLRLRESSVAGAQVGDRWLLVAVVLAVVCVAVHPLWRMVRTLVTVAHESGHALVGLLCGRRFEGFVVSADMSGQTTTSGRPTGPGRVATTAAGYPMPAALGTGIIAVTLAGRAGLVLLIAWVLLVIVLFRARTVFTVVTLVLLLAGVGLLWWASGPQPCAAAVIGVGVLLLLGAWRQWLNVVRHGDGRQDPEVLAELTRVPRAAWNLAFGLVIAVFTWLAGRMLVPGLEQALLSW